MITILIGKSATGKDTILRELRNEYGYEPIISTTSRPMRENEKDHVDYIFVSSEIFRAMIQIGCFIEYRSYNTLVNGNPDTWYYGVQTFEPDDNRNYVVILDVEGAKSFIDYFGKDNLRIIYIDSDDDIRKSRAEKRGSFNETEWQRRFIDDNIKFSCDVCDSLCDSHINNNGIKTIREIVKEIHEFVNN